MNQAPGIIIICSERDCVYNKRSAIPSLRIAAHICIKTNVHITSEFNGELCDSRKEHKSLNVKITDIDISVRALNALKHHNIKTLGDLLHFHRDRPHEYRTSRYIGTKTKEEIRSILEEYGLIKKLE